MGTCFYTLQCHMFMYILTITHKENNYKVYCLR